MRLNSTKCPSHILLAMPLVVNYAAYSIGKYEPKTLDHLAGIVGRRKVMELLTYLSVNGYVEISRVRNGQGRSGFGIVIHYGTMNCGTPYGLRSIQPFDTKEWITLPYNKGFCSFTNSHIVMTVKVKEPEPADDEFSVFCKEVMDKIVSNNPNRTVNITDKSIRQGATALCMLKVKDGHSFEHIKEVINWALQNPFWQKNIFSMAPMRARSKNGLMKFENIANGYLDDYPEGKKSSNEFNEVTVNKVEI